MKPSELFVISAVLLLGFSLLSPLITPTGLGISITLRGNVYVLQPISVCTALATLLCFIATIYSLWMLPFNRTAMLWHFWLTMLGIVSFWVSFYRVPNSRTAVWVVLLSPVTICLVQLIFLWNVVQAIFRMPKLHS